MNNEIKFDEIDISQIPDGVGQTKNQWLYEKIDELKSGKALKVVFNNPKSYQGLKATIKDRIKNSRGANPERLTVKGDTPNLTMYIIREH